LLSDNVSTLDLDVLYRSQGSEQKFRPMPTWMDQMNPELRKHEVLGQIVTSLLLDGNAYISTLRDRAGRVVSISVLDPMTITPSMKTDEDGLSRITFQSDQAQGIEFTARDIVMVRNLLKPGQIEGVSPITAAREFIGLGLATGRYGSSFFGNGALPGAVIEVPGQLSEVGAQQLKSSWESVHKGAANGSRLAVLTEGSEFSRQLSLSPEDSQFILTKQSTVQDVCRLYGVPPHLLADSSGSTSWGSGLAERFDCQRTTIREALQYLEGRGAIYRRGRSGWFVSPKRLDYDLSLPIPLAEIARLQGRELTTAVLVADPGMQPPCRESDAAFLVLRSRALDGQPVVIERIYMPDPYRTSLLNSDLARPISSLLEEELELEITGERLTLNPTVMDSELASLFTATAGAPVLEIERSRYSRGSLVSVDVECWRPEAVRVTVNTVWDQD
jgi:HK97 family phage portal protein